MNKATIITGLVIIGILAVAGISWVAFQPRTPLNPSAANGQELQELTRVQLTVTPATSTTGAVSLSWTASPGAVQYNVYRSNAFFSDTSDTNNSILIATTGFLTATDQLKVNGPYYYGVIAINSTGKSKLSNVPCIVVNIPVDQLQFWRAIWPNVNLQLSNRPFGLSSFLFPIKIASSPEGVTVYELSDSQVSRVIPINTNMGPDVACTNYNVYTVSATGLCALNFRGSSWYLFVRPGG